MLSLRGFLLFAFACWRMFFDWFLSVVILREDFSLGVADNEGGDALFHLLIIGRFPAVVLRNILAVFKAAGLLVRYAQFVIHGKVTGIFLLVNDEFSDRMKRVP